MTRYNKDFWLNELEENEPEDETCYDISEDVLNDVHEAMNRFHHKDTRKSKFKKKNQCWQ